MNDSFITDREFEVGGKQWQIKPLLSYPAKKLFYQHVRPCVGTIGDLEITKERPDGTIIEMNQAQVLMAVIGKVPQEHLVALTEVLIDSCLWYKNTNKQGRFMPVKGKKEEVFANMKVSDLTIIDARLFCVNFGESVSDLVQLFRPPVPVEEADESQK
ncbi:MAG: hypothetical protein ISN29_02075 [Gammaproteobacteria bacterium AqS3]|nr:hypothetical protein [Gammaproteobacteria bacterium AqS3]